MMKKIVTMTVLFCTIFSTTAFAASKSGTEDPYYYLILSY